MRPDPIYCGERFDEHAAYLDAWRADRERLQAEEASAHVRLDRAVERIVGGPTPMERAHGPGFKAPDTQPRTYRSALDRDGSPAPMPGSPILDASVLDRMAQLVAALDPRWEEADECSEWCAVIASDAVDALRALIRSTGRGCYPWGLTSWRHNRLRRSARSS
jgi:hypothetical protein